MAHETSGNRGDPTHLGSGSLVRVTKCEELFGQPPVGNTVPEGMFWIAPSGISVRNTPNQNSDVGCWVAMNFQYLLGAVQPREHQVNHSR